MNTIDQLRSGKLSGARRLHLSCDLTVFPPEILDLADTLEILDMSGNRLSDLPAEFTNLKRLKILFLSNNEFTEFPTVLSGCVHLSMIGMKANKISDMAEDVLPQGIRWLILTNNRLTQIPSSIGKCVNLQKLMLAGNQLSELPETMIHCKKLELLRISANSFEKLPSWLFSMPRLSWLALAGNPITRSGKQKDQLLEIPWTELELEHLLGEGASGLISKARWRTGMKEQEVAVKVFKGEVTSDGLPSDEMNACIAAGAHVHLVNVLGKIVRHPQQKAGLVFDLIDPAFRNLGGPPDFETCTRDTFKLGTAFSVQQIQRIVKGIASAVAHLHERNISHGDLYAHNILIDQEANSLLGDFGAASIYDGMMIKYSAALERIEVRAFGCLLEDLINHVDVKNNRSLFMDSLVQLQHDCMQETVALRPDFVTINKRIKNMSDIL